jgi:hypothetical protein
MCGSTWPVPRCGSCRWAHWTRTRRGPASSINCWPPTPSPPTRRTANWSDSPHPWSSPKPSPTGDDPVLVVRGSSKPAWKASWGGSRLVYGVPYPASADARDRRLLGQYRDRQRPAHVVPDLRVRLDRPGVLPQGPERRGLAADRGVRLGDGREHRRSAWPRHRVVRQLQGGLASLAKCPQRCPGEVSWRWRGARRWSLRAVRRSRARWPRTAR